jgi:hypothetical protein
MAARGEPGERNRDPNPFEISRWKATRSSRKAEDVVTYPTEMLR